MMRLLSQMRNLRGYATKLFHSSHTADVIAFRGAGALPPPTSPPPFTSPSEVVTLMAFGAVNHAFFVWLHDRGSNKYQAWKIESKLQSMLDELDRKRKESPEAYLEMIHREIQSLKPLIDDREILTDWEVKDYERKIAVLESELHAWIKGEDTAPVSQGYLRQNSDFVYGAV